MRGQSKREVLSNRNTSLIGALHKPDSQQPNMSVVKNSKKPSRTKLLLHDGREETNRSSSNRLPTGGGQSTRMQRDKSARNPPQLKNYNRKQLVRSNTMQKDRNVDSIAASVKNTDTTKGGTGAHHVKAVVLTPDCKMANIDADYERVFDSGKTGKQSALPKLTIESSKADETDMSPIQLHANLGAPQQLLSTLNRPAELNSPPAFPEDGFDQSKGAPGSQRKLKLGQQRKSSELKGSETGGLKVPDLGVKIYRSPNSRTSKKKKDLNSSMQHLQCPSARRDHRREGSTSSRPPFENLTRRSKSVMTGEDLCSSDSGKKIDRLSK